MLMHSCFNYFTNKDCFIFVHKMTLTHSSDVCVLNSNIHMFIHVSYSIIKVNGHSPRVT